MACLGGTVEEPRRWVRYNATGEWEEGSGRSCKRTVPWTTVAGDRFRSAWTCGSCVLYRGFTRGRRATGLNPLTDEPVVLSLDERTAYLAAQEEAEENGGEWGPLMIRFVARMNGELYGLRSLRLAGEVDAQDEWAARMRDYRRDHPEYVARDKAAARLRMRRYRERKALRRYPASERSGG